MLKYNIDSAFKATPESILEFFQRPGIGFYIPNYQRPYSWDEDNVTQMMEDLCSGVEMLRSNDDAVTFFGTLIMLSAGKNKDQVAPKDPKAVPSEVLITIDGQQRLSTMALLGIHLHYRILEIAANLPTTPPYAELREEAGHVASDLLNVFALDMKSGTPALKPKIIRAQDDTWTFDGGDEAYKSEVAHYLAMYIRSLKGSALPKTEKKSRIAGNVRAVEEWLNRIANAHVAGTPLDGRYPVGDVLMTMEFQSHLWKYERPELAAIVQQRAGKKTSSEYRASALAQLFLFANYFLQRCCLTITRPTNEDWAFDMFQSLNATGTPLTAMETFLPLVIREEEREKAGYKKSISARNMQRVDELLNVKDNATKNSLTNSLLTSFALAYNGDKLPSKFSAQRKWLNAQYIQNTTLNEKRKFTEYLSDVADFTDRCWLMGFTSEPGIIVGLEGHDEKKLTSFLMRYMKDANFQIIGSVLSRFYEGVAKTKPNATEEFVAAVKATAAFFTLWRSARSNSGLDDVFRRLMRDGYDDGDKLPPLSWFHHPAAPLADQLKRYYRYVLNTENLGDQNQWTAKAKGFLSYRSAKVVCRFLLFITANDTDVDAAHPGLMRLATQGVNNMYDPELWTSVDFKEIEHVAPENPAEGSGWDSALYPEEAIHEIGNLTLLPKEINASAGNQNWPTKLLYYQHLGVTIPEEIESLREEAIKLGITLSPATVDILHNATHKHHMKPIIQRPIDAPWDLSFVQQRSLRILDIGWQRMYAWLADAKAPKA